MNFANNIFVLLYGRTNNNFIVPLLNSSLTIVPAIITTVSIIKNPYESKTSKNCDFAL